MPPAPVPPAVVMLDDARAADASLAGAKAANLARAARAGAAVLPGFVLTTAGAERGLRDPGVAGDLERAWARLGGAAATLVVRSSSTLEDASASSMAGQFTSVLDVRGWDAFLVATQRVLDSAGGIAPAGGATGPMAVLAQRQLDTAMGGVLFGVDPVHGGRGRIVVEVVRSRPEALVSGTALATQHVLTRTGRLLERVDGADGAALGRRSRRRLARLAARAGRAFGSAQDIEWALDGGGALWLLQSRPVTATGPGRLHGPLMGPGPVAETFPSPMGRLYADLWLEPLRDGIVRALRATAAVSRRRIARSPVLVAVGGWAAVDLEVLGVATGHPSSRARLSPLATARRLGVAWRVGRLRVALGALAADAVATVDGHLGAVGELPGLDAGELVEAMGLARRELVTVHTLEVLAGMLAPAPPAAGSAAQAGLVALADGRRRGLDDASIIERSPEVLALAPPAAGGTWALPATAPPPAGRTGVPGPGGLGQLGVDALGARDALRLRARWLQELLARAAGLVGRDLASRGAVASADLVGELSWPELVAVVAGGPAPDALAARAAAGFGPPLPGAFRLSGSGAVVATVAHPRRGRVPRRDGVPAASGRAVGTVRHRVVPGSARAGVVLVTEHLTPQLAAVLPSIEGLVSETGSALSHLAILAREAGVPTVVAVPGARARFPQGCRVVVDGDTGLVERLGGEGE